MTDMAATQMTDDSRAALDLLLRSHSIRLCDRQRQRLEWLVARCGKPIVWDKQRDVAGAPGVIIVIEPPTGPERGAILHALHPGCVVTIPFGENPAFDFLKSKLTDFGTIGASGADGPHELWWGGRGWPAALERTAAAHPLVISCYPRADNHDGAERLKESLDALGLDT